MNLPDININRVYEYFDGPAIFVGSYDGYSRPESFLVWWWGPTETTEEWLHIILTDGDIEKLESGTIDYSSFAIEKGVEWMWVYGVHDNDQSKNVIRDISAEELYNMLPEEKFYVEDADDWTVCPI